MKDLQGRTAVVTGAASGIGLAMVESFAAEGMNIVMADIEATRLHSAADVIRGKGAKVVTAVTDVSRPEQVETLADRAYDEFGAVHVLCNNAGVEVIGAAWEQTLADWRWVMDVNLWGVVYGVHHFLPRMMAQDTEGHIVNTASMAGLSTAPYMSIYNVTKFGVVALSETLYKELVMNGSKLRVSVVCPGLIKTDILKSSRNRPADVGEGGKFGDAAQGFRSALTTGLETGYPPSEVARQVLEAVKDERFYVIPAQEQVFQNAIIRMEDIKERRNPPVR